MDILIIIGIATLIYTLVGFGYNIIDYCIDRQKKKDYEKLDKNEDYIIRGHIDYNNNMNKQTVYKVNGDFNGDIKGDNVTVILMGNGNFNGDISSKDGEVVLIKGNINGDVKANKIVCPTKPTTDNNTTKHNPAKDVESPKLPVKTLWSCDIPQGRIDHYTSIGNHVSMYGSSPVTHITCPHCKKHFATQLRVRTSVVDGDVVETSVEEMRHDY